MLAYRFGTAAAVLAVVLGGGDAWAADRDLALKRVMLSTGGVGYFEYEAKVSGDADLELTVRRDRVDDVLKSIVVYDDQGGIGTISLPGREPLRELFQELPFGPEAFNSPSTLFSALRGAELRLTGPRELVGRLISITEEPVALPDHAGIVTRHRLTLMTAEGVRQAILEDVESVRLADGRLQGQVDTALAALAQHDERDRRTLTLHTTGSGPRTVRVAYVVEAPLWKVAYRLTLEAGGAKVGGLQGWAVLENLSGEDWTGVDLTVVSGNPVTFRQALYDAYYVARPEVPVEVLGRVLPKTDQGAMPVPQPRPLAALAAPTPKMMTRGMAIGTDMANAAWAPAPPPGAEPGPPRLAEVAAAEAGEATTQVTFHHQEPVSVANGHSLLLPIVSRAIPAEPLALYQPATEPRHPLAAVRLRNDGTTSLPPGILTLYQRDTAGSVSYVGDARLSPLPAGQERLLSFAVDQKVGIDRGETQSDSITAGSIVDGVLHLTTTDRATTTYTVAGAASEARRVVIEHPRLTGWTLVSPAAETIETTADAYRIASDVAAGQTVTVTVVAERPRVDRYELADLSDQEVQLALNARSLSVDLHKALARVTDLRGVVARQQELVDRLEQEQEDVTKDAERLRGNIQTVGSSSDLGRRYMAKLGSDEDRLDKLDRDIGTARAAVAASKQALADYVKGLKL